jgi:putative peptide maturation system protein
VHYDALLGLAGEGTVSLSFCPERALPWPVRGVHRWDEQTLLRVNRTFLKVDEAVACVDFIWDQAPVIKRLVNRCLVQEELEKSGIALSAEELQEAMDAFRRTRRLYKAEDTVRWLERHGTTQEKLEGLVAGEAVVGKLRDQLTAGKVEAYFQQHQARFESAWVAQMSYLDRETAQQSSAQIQAGQLDFYAAAQQRFLAGTSPGAGSAQQLFSVVRRGELEEEAAAAIFSARAGDMIGPIQMGEGFSLVRLLAAEKPRLDAAVREAIKKILFDNWLEERRQAANVEWLWGNARQTETPVDAVAQTKV